MRSRVSENSVSVKRLGNHAYGSKKMNRQPGTCTGDSSFFSFTVDHMCVYVNVSVRTGNNLTFVILSNFEMNL